MGWWCGVGCRAAKRTVMKPGVEGHDGEDEGGHMMSEESDSAVLRHESTTAHVDELIRLKAEAEVEIGGSESLCGSD